MALTPKIQRFCEEYLIDMNATQAAKRAGYSEKTAHQSGYELLKKPEIKEYISKRVAESAMDKEEALKLVADIARSNLADYMTKRQVKRYPMIEKSVKRLITEYTKKIQFEEEFIRQAKLTGEALAAVKAQIAEWKLDIVRFKIEAKKNPKAKRIVKGDPILVEEAELDIIKIMEDKQRGRIKAVKPTEFGLQVEMYSADSAIVNILKIHGAFEKDNKQKKPELGSIKVEIVEPSEED
jgi:phage terminase small subunit